MNFQDFQTKLSTFTVFSLNDITKVMPQFNKIQLGRWSKKGYLTKIKRGYYCLSSQDNNQHLLLHAANKIYAPSYVSLETALKYYGFIPEEIFQITSVGTKKSTGFHTPIGNFSYRHIKPSLYWGYRLVDVENKKILLAEPEKAVLDYLYVNNHLNTAKEFEEIRMNDDEFATHVNTDTLLKYAKGFCNKRFLKRVNTFLTTLQHAHD